jgi:hypothetical protein
MFSINLAMGQQTLESVLDICSPRRYAVSENVWTVAWEWGDVAILRGMEKFPFADKESLQCAQAEIASVTLTEL